MGMPILSYARLRDLADPTPSPSRRAIQYALRNFSLFALVLYDPETHPEFDKTLRALFDVLDFATGPSLLFFAVTDPPDTWLERAARRGYVEALTNFDPAKDMPSAHRDPADPSVTAFTFAQALGIPTDDLPCIVVAQSLRSPQYLWIRSDSTRLQNQLSTLGLLADRRRAQRLPGLRNYSHEFKQLVEQVNDAAIDPHGTLNTIQLSRSLVTALTEALSFIIATGHDPRFRQEAQQQARASLTRLSQEIHTARTNLGQEDAADQQQLDTLLLQQAAFTAQLSFGQMNLGYESAITKAFLEPDSYQTLKTGYHILTSLTDSAAFDWDFSPAVVCFAKVFEKEVNLSVVHWMRQERGIELPQFFNLPQPAKTAVVQAVGGGRVSLNERSNGQWLAPAIGQSKIAFKTLSDTQEPPGWDRARIPELLEQWNIIHKLRNQAAHTGLLSKTNATEIHAAINTLARDGTFERFSALKTLYRGK